jgi:hypothetical protein
MDVETHLRGAVTLPTGGNGQRRQHAPQNGQLFALCPRRPRPRQPRTPLLCCDKNSAPDRSPAPGASELGRPGSRADLPRRLVLKLAADPRYKGGQPCPLTGVPSADFTPSRHLIPRGVPRPAPSAGRLSRTAPARSPVACGGLRVSRARSPAMKHRPHPQPARRDIRRDQERLVARAGKEDVRHVRTAGLDRELLACRGGRWVLRCPVRLCPTRYARHAGLAILGLTASPNGLDKPLQVSSRKPFQNNVLWRWMTESTARSLHGGCPATVAQDLVRPCRIRGYGQRARRGHYRLQFKRLEPLCNGPGTTPIPRLQQETERTGLIMWCAGSLQVP